MSAFQFYISSLWKPIMNFKIRLKCLMKNEIFPLRPQSQVISGDSTSITMYVTQTSSLLNAKNWMKLFFQIAHFQTFALRLFLGLVHITFEPELCDLAFKCYHE